MLKLKLLGMPAIFLGDTTITLKTNKSQALLYYLAVNRGFHSRDLLADLFWPHMQTQQARKNLRDALSQLRAQIGDYLLVDRQKLALNTALPYASDAEKFLHQIEQGKLTNNLALVEAGLDHYQGEFLAGLHLLDAITFESWRSRQREIYARYAIDAKIWLATTYYENQRYLDGITIARDILMLEPWQENIHRLLMALFVCTGNQVAAIRQYEICRQRLASAMGIVPSRETEQLYTQIRQGTFPPATPNPTAPRPDYSVPISVTPVVLTQTDPRSIPHNLPRLMMPLVGRAEELSHLQRLLLDPAYPLVTLVGQGGVGKTCLAVAAAQHLTTQAHTAHDSEGLALPLGLAAFPDGIWFVDLSTFSEEKQNAKQTGETLAVAIAAAMNLTLTVDGPYTKQLGLALRNKAALLILDNFEQLFSSINDLLDLLQMTQAVQLLVTSRQRLALDCEYVFALKGLAFPPLALQQPAMELITAQLLHYSAMQLFCEYAQRAEPAFRLTAANWEAVVRLCHLLDGLPLAIELATSLLTVYSCQQLTDLLAQDYRVLTSNRTDLPARQRSMDAVLAASWRLLQPEETLILAGCSQLYGAVDLAAIQATTGATIAQVRKLIHRSLLHRDQSSERFTLHTLVRQYAAEQLRRHPKLAQRISQQHAEYFLNLLGARQWSLLDDAQQLQQAKDYWENLKSAWQWSITAGRLDLLARGARGLAYLYRLDGRLHEAIALFTPAIILARQQVAAYGSPFAQQWLADLLSCTGEFYQLLGQTAAARALAEELMSLGKTLGDLLYQAKALKDLASVAKINGDYHAMYSYGLQAVSLLQALELLARSEITHDPHRQAAALSDLIAVAALDNNSQWEETHIARYKAQGMALLHGDSSALWLRAGCLAAVTSAGIALGLFEESMASGRAALACLRRVPDRDLEAEINLHLGINCQRRKEYMPALEYLMTALRLSDTRQNQRIKCLSQCQLAELYCNLGAYDQAQALYEELFTLMHADDSLGWKARFYTGYGRLLHLHGNFTAARSNYQCALAHFMQTPADPARATTLLYLAELLTEMGEWEEAAATYQKLRKQQATSVLRHGYADLYAGLAMLSGAQKQWSAALAQVRQALMHLATEGIALCEEPLRVYQRAIFVLNAVGEDSTATVVEAAKALVQHQAIAISNSELRQSFLTKIAAVVAIRQGTTHNLART